MISEALARGDGALALSQALEQWRTHRAPALSALVSTIGARSTELPQLPVATAKGAAADQAWVDLARTANDLQLSHALAALVQHFKTARFTWPIVELLADREPDPRIADFACALLLNLKSMRHTSGKQLRRLVECVERHGDASHAPQLKAPAIAGWGGISVERVKNVKKKLQTRPVTFTEALELPSEAPLTFSAPTSTVRTGAALLAAVYENPADDALRLVYADWLLEHGDPRGEFIRLQYLEHEGTLTARDEKKMNALQRRHAYDWYKGIWAALSRDRAQLLGPLLFERGFLVSAEVRPPKRAPSDLWLAPEWSTVERLRGQPVITPAMKSLKRRR